MAAKDDYGMLDALAKRLKLEGDDKDSFISDAMKRLGYKAKSVWEDGENNNDDGDFFARRRKASGENWQYK